MIAHHEWLLLPERAAVHLPTATAVIADLHLGYNEARQRAGDAVPVVSVARMLAPLAATLAIRNIHRLVIAGDLFEAGAEPGIVCQFQQWLLHSGLELVGVVPGNHDKKLNRTSWPLQENGYSLGKWLVKHGHEPACSGCEKAGPVNLVHGHWHPCWRWQGRKWPCFVIGARQLVLPAYSPDAAGACWKPQGKSERLALIVTNEIVEVRYPEQRQNRRKAKQ